jgi:hypothetical protein
MVLTIRAMDFPFQKNTNNNQPRVEEIQSYDLNIQLRLVAPVRIRFRSGRSLLLDTAFHSPAAITCLAASLRGRVNAPGLHLQSRLRISFDPFGSPLPPLSWVFCAPQGAISAVHPLSNPIRKRFVCSQAAAPLQDLSILPVHSALPKFSRKSLPLRGRR